MNRVWVRVLRVVLVLLAIAWFVWGYRSQQMVVASFDGSEAEAITPAEFIEGMSVDGYLRDNEAIFDIFTNSPESVQARDCHT